MRHLFRTSALTIIGMGFATVATAQVLAAQGKTDADWVNELADMAGGAAYCNIEQDKQDVFLNLAHAKLAALAGDQASKIVNKIQFNNALNRTSSKEPVGGCALFVPMLEQAIERLN